MQLRYAALALAFLAEQVYNVEAKAFLAEVRLGRRSTEMSVDYDALYRRVAQPQAPSSVQGSVGPSPTVTADTAESSAPDMGNATDLCAAALSNLNGVATSLTGMSLCYDVASLDINTGAFISNVYLYQVSPAAGNWTTINGSSLMDVVGYPSSNIVQMSVTKRNIFKRVSDTPDDAPVLVVSQQYSGQVNQGSWNPSNITEQMLALTPIVHITALTPSGQLLNATLPTDEAAFITGFYAKTAIANAAAAASAAASIPFVLPGVAPAFFPVGGVVVGAWVFLFTLVVGLGTFGRWQLRRDYRSRAGSRNWRPAGTTGGVAAYDQR
ncbi:MAG: hypothetical protein LQ340_001498 [Diploschistes diacapsis]|nr:MAG: hypothetical protein LQ340_001498 [Diploschistes diacapsis]